MKSSYPSKILSSPVSLYLLVSFLAFFPCLVLGRAYFDNDLLAQFGPWRAFLRGQLAQGHIPLWNPYNLGGMPFFADLQNMMLYPLNCLTLPFPTAYGLSIFFFIHMVWAALGMHLWLEELGLSPKARVTGALLFASSGFFWLEIIHPPVLAAYAWLPWFFGRIEKLSSNLKPRHSFLTGANFAMLFLCGSFQMTLGAIYGGLAYFFFRFYKNIKKNNPTFAKGGKGGFSGTSPIRKFSLCALLFIWGSLPLWGQLIPTLELSNLSDRKLSPKSAEQLSPALSLNPQTLYQFLLPRFSLPQGQKMAEAFQGREGLDKGSGFTANLGYMGLWMPFLAWISFRRKENSLILFFSIFSLLALAVSLGRFLPFHAFFYNYVPGFSLILVPYRFLYLFLLGAAPLAAFGFDQWLAGLPKKPETLGRLSPPLGYALVLTCFALVHPLQNWREIAALTLGLAGLLTASLLPRFRDKAVLLFQAGLILPLFLNGWACFEPGPSSNFNFEKNSRTIVEIGRQALPNRILFDNLHLKYPIELGGQKYLVNYPQNAACAIGIKNFGGYNPLILRSKVEFGTLPIGSLSQAGALQGILTQEPHGDIPGFRLESHPPFYFYAAGRRADYVFAPETLLSEPDPAKNLALVQKPDFDLAKTAVLFEPVPGDLAVHPPQAPPVQLTYRLDQDGIDDQNFSVTINQTRLVVFCELMYPGWKAFVDGKPTPLLTADHFLRGLYLLPGFHQIQFRFEPDWLQPLGWGLVLWFLLTGVFWFYSRRPFVEKG